ncbi:ABC transporter ATP-binding protein [Adlercreutzia sp. ZJ154]|uniref:ABC transporter ATP-binding protein n=1 Tax=Adlercreutzia sp. ZJ154 TaxID=2709790 RepID=UPI0013EAC834|nr:ABC transporter ATP-binding protein [Adlercreutzia sp. ZJ154]
MELSLENIGLRLSGKTILDDVSFTVGDGQFMSILGESGAGKSTTLKVISGLILQDSGRVLFDGCCVDDMPTHKRDIAIVFQDIRLFPNMDVAQNVAFPLKMRKVAKAERMRVAEEMLEAVQLGGYGSRRTYELSGGQQQRVALARALAAKPRALLLDEPFSGLDEQLREEMRKLVSSLHERFNITSLMVTHDPDEALTMSDSIVFMRDGKLVQVGTPRDMLLHPAHKAVKACFGEASAIEGSVEAGVFTSGKLVIPAPDVVDGAAVLVRAPDTPPFVHSL